MHRRRYEQRTVFEAITANLIADYSDLRMDAELQRLDKLLADEELVLIVHRALGERYPNSRRTGRDSTPSEVVLRLLVLKHIRDWSFDVLEQEVRGSLVYRQFTRIGFEKVPDAKSLIRLSNVIGPEVLRSIHERVVAIAREKRVARGLKMRVDTTVVGTDIRYPTDSRLLGDAVRVITRVGRRLVQAIGAGRVKLRNRMRSVSRRILEIALSSRVHTETAERKRTQIYQRLMAATRSVVREAKAMSGRGTQGSHRFTMALASFGTVAHIGWLHSGPTGRCVLSMRVRRRDDVAAGQSDVVPDIRTDRERSRGSGRRLRTMASPPKPS